MEKKTPNQDVNMEKKTPTLGVYHKIKDSSLLELRISSTGIPVFVHGGGGFVPGCMDEYILVEPNATLADFKQSAISSEQSPVAESAVLLRFTEAALTGFAANPEVIKDASHWDILGIFSARAAREALRELTGPATSQPDARS